MRQSVATSSRVDVAGEAAYGVGDAGGALVLGDRVGGQGEQVEHELLDARGTPLDGADHQGLLLAQLAGIAAAHHLGVPDHHRQGGAQLVVDQRHQQLRVDLG